MILVVYADHILLGANDVKMLDSANKYLYVNFEDKDMGETSYVIRI